jgi:protein-L-isoaspartate(D-aspartate) O-methyltransferase
MSFLLALRARGVLDTSTLRAFELVPRDAFVLERFAALSREDVSLPLPCGQTQPSPSTIVRLLAALGATAGDRVLEIGTGSGYITALLSHIGLSVISMERYRTLVDAARIQFQRLGLANIRVIQGDGSRGLVDEGPFDKIIVHGSFADGYEPLLEQLTPNGSLVGILRAGQDSELTRWRRNEGNRSVEMDRFGRLDLPLLAHGTAAFL